MGVPCCCVGCRHGHRPCCVRRRGGAAHALERAIQALRKIEGTRDRRDDLHQRHALPDHAAILVERAEVRVASAARRLGGYLVAKRAQRGRGRRLRHPEDAAGHYAMALVMFRRDRYQEAQVAIDETIRFLRGELARLQQLEPAANLLRETLCGSDPILHIRVDRPMKKRGSRHERTLREFRLDGGCISVGATLASTSHFFPALIEQAAGIKFKYVSYEGLAPRMNAILGGHVDLTDSNLTQKGKVDAGQLKFLAIATESDEGLALKG